MNNYEQNDTARKANYWTAILWVPYFVLFIYLIAYQFPITYEGDSLTPVTVLLVIGALIGFPLYILVINFFGFVSDDKPHSQKENEDV
ncbi:hypothetical protein [Bacillus sp. SA1-12]|uniref:hypothetical protein n=1 Tax=Bacillus sp. SA1-12 TaxID=1455638 RepID=UPI000697C7C7|nr:hypothetical protein [Bacillus sp. SA1-12]